MDTGAFVALHDPGDQFHVEAVDAWKQLDNERCLLVTTHVVLVETLALIARALGSNGAAELGRTMLCSRSLSIVRPTDADDAEALDEIERFADQRIGFADCLSFVIMRRLRIERAFTFDRRHFSIGGFSVFP